MKIFKMVVEVVLKMLVRIKYEGGDSRVAFALEIHLSSKMTLLEEASFCHDDIWTSPAVVVWTGGDQRIIHWLTSTSGPRWRCSEDSL